MADRFLSRLDRIAKAVELLAAEETEIQMEVSPPVCPHCGMFNPMVRVIGDSEGPLMDCVLQAECGNCHLTMLAVPIQWDMLPDVSSYERYVTERTALQDAGRATNND